MLTNAQKYLNDAKQQQQEAEKLLMQALSTAVDEQKLEIVKDDASDDGQSVKIQKCEQVLHGK